MMKKTRNIPYGVGDFESVQLKNEYYVDKTMFISEVEKTRYNFLIRPRRFGKTLFLTMLQAYYDISLKERFQELFRNTWVLKNPTAIHNSYMILYFNFSLVNPDINKVEDSFTTYCNSEIAYFLRTYSNYIGNDITKRVSEKKLPADKLNEILISLKGNEHKIYLFIDEYDNFANTIISRHGQHEYQKLTHGEGFFRYFFNILKGGASGRGSGLDRMFITGVSPITMDDVTSGFNIGNNISLNENMNEALGFTEKDVDEIIDYYTGEGVFKFDKAETKQIMSEWYNNYIFSEDGTTKMYNTDMVLYYMKEANWASKPPRYLIDENVRIDYGKLRHLMTIGNKLNGNFNILKDIIANGGIASRIVKSFPYEELTKQENFVSLLYFFGLLSLDGTLRGKPYFSIPNNTIRQLMYSYIRGAYEDVGTFKVNVFKLDKLISNMAYVGEWKELFTFIADEINKQTKIRDFIEGEKVIQTFFMAYINIVDTYTALTEEEANKGYADLVLKPFFYNYPDAKFGYLIELKYIARSEYTEALKNKKIKESQDQLAKYSNDDNLKKMMQFPPYGSVEIRKLIIVFNAWEMVYCEEVKT
ncbi:MAG: AAA family ATPase [Bacteroidota bacterium]|nr:AAA family ATPase [Bacteroidota bacterium]